jgi:hypothetical protein
MLPFRAMKPQSGGRPYPDVATLSARVATLEGLSTIVDLGLTWTPEMAVLHPALKVTGAGHWGAASPRRPASFPFRNVVDLSPQAVRGLLVRLDLARCAVVITGPSDSVADIGQALAAVDAIVREAPLTIVATTDPEPVLAYLTAADLRPSFVGRTRIDEQDTDRSAHLLVVDRSIVDEGTAPGDFKVVAIMTAFNEEDIIGPAIGKLVADGVGVYIIDNWSTDATHSIAEQFRDRGLVGLERFPDSPADRFSLRSLMPRVAAVAAGLDADWVIHHDADERRCGPWTGIGLRDALWRVDRSGFNAVDHTVLNYRPLDNGFPSGGDFEAYFRHFEFGRTSDLRLQVKAWKNAGPVDLASKAGHEARFLDRRIFPYKFELKHYPIRSQAHGERKVFHDRVPRWDPRERRLAWHVQYDGVLPNQSFVRAREDLIEDRGVETRACFLPELIAGAGLGDYSIPAYALGGFRGRSVYLFRGRVARSGPYRFLSWFAGLPPRAVRKALRLPRGKPSTRVGAGG